jgi:hypothetical protein
MGKPLDLIISRWEFEIDPNVAANMLLLLIQEIWKEEKLPREWAECITVKIPKKGDLSKLQKVGLYLSKYKEKWKTSVTKYKEG